MIIPITVGVLSTSKAPRVEKGIAVPMVEQFAILRAHPSFVRHVLAYGLMTVGVAILSGGILFITTDVAIRQGQSDAYQAYFNTVELSDSQMERLGLTTPEGGHRDRAGNLVDPAQVQVIDPTQPGWLSPENLDYDAMQDSPYGRIQGDAVLGVIKGAIQQQVIGPAKALVGLAGFFSAVFALFLIGSILSQLIWVPLSRFIGRGRALVIGLVLYGILACAYLLVLRGQNPSLIIYGAFFLGLCNGAYQNLPWAILPTMIDEANASAKVNVEGVFNGFWLSGQKIANSVGPALFGQLIAIYGYQKSTIGFRAQSEDASSMLELFMTVLPGAFFLLAIPLFLTVRADLRR